MVICLERGADLHMAQLMPLPLTVSCSSKIQIGFAFLVPAYPGFLEKRPLNGCWLSGTVIAPVYIDITADIITHTHTHPFNVLFSGTTPGGLVTER